MKYEPLPLSLRQHLTHIFVWAVVLAVFAPSLFWLGTVAATRDQVRDAAVVLMFGVIFLLRERPAAARWALRFDERSLCFLGVACVIAGLGSFFHQPLLLVIALGLLAGAILLFMFGHDVTGPATGLAIAFSGFTVLAIIFPLADLPMRVFAGQASAQLLDLFGSKSELAFVGDPARLILVSGGRPFEVAPECNGFGITSSSMLLGLLLAFSRKLRLLDKVLVIVLAPLVGLFSNALRILVIVALAPVAGPGGYLVMHEVVGIALFLGTLIFIWWLVSGLPERPRPVLQMKSAIS